MLKDMSDEIKFELKLLGTGTSTGVPTISCSKLAVRLECN